MHALFMRFSRIMAILGGVMLTALIVLVCVSITGRSLNTVLHNDWVEATLPGLSAWLLGLGIGPVTGDFELVEAGIAFAIFAFLPLTQITSGHAAVDIFTAWLPRRANRLLGAVIEAVFALVLIVIAVQLADGMLSKRRSGTTTFLIQFPLWWAYALSLSAAAMAALVGIYVACARWVELFTGRVILSSDGGAQH